VEVPSSPKIHRLFVSECHCAFFSGLRGFLTRRQTSYGAPFFFRSIKSFLFFLLEYTCTSKSDTNSGESRLENPTNTRNLRGNALNCISSFQLLTFHHFYRSGQSSASLDSSSLPRQMCAVELPPASLLYLEILCPSILLEG